MLGIIWYQIQTEIAGLAHLQQNDQVETEKLEKFKY